jgi:hypothetical protein
MHDILGHSNAMLWPHLRNSLPAACAEQARAERKSALC